MGRGGSLSFSISLPPHIVTPHPSLHTKEGRISVTSKASPPPLGTMYQLLWYAPSLDSSGS